MKQLKRVLSKRAISHSIDSIGVDELADVRGAGGAGGSEQQFRRVRRAVRDFRFCMLIICVICKGLAG